LGGARKRKWRSREEERRRCRKLPVVMEGG
jgi:hypothetical protein